MDERSRQQKELTPSREGFSQSLNKSTKQNSPMRLTANQSTIMSQTRLPAQQKLSQTIDIQKSPADTINPIQRKMSFKDRYRTLISFSVENQLENLKLRVKDLGNIQKRSIKGLGMFVIVGHRPS